MKKLSFNLMIALLSALMMISFNACDDDDDPEPQEEEETSDVPVVGEDFNFNVDGNDVVFTTSLTGSVWFRNETDGTDHNATDGEVSVNLPMGGTYQFTCNTLVDGQTKTSEEFDVVIESSDLAFLESGVWNALTGGADGGKVWELDLVEVVTTTIDNAGNETSASTYTSAYFHNPLDFYGDSEAGAEEGDEWGPWGGTNIYGWGGTPEIGEISFDGVNKTVSLVFDDGVEAGTGTAVPDEESEGYVYNEDAQAKTGTFEGSFSMEVYDRDPDFLTLADGATLWENMLNGQYSYLGSLSEQMSDISFGEGLRFPMDKGRVGEGQFTDEDLRNVTIMHASDSALVVRVKRSFEGFDESGAQKTSTAWLLYNYTVKGYDYGIKETPTHPVASGVTDADLVGTWELATVPGDWIGWASSEVLNGFADGAAMNETFVGWGIENTEEKYAASGNVSLTFNDNGTCTISNVIYESDAEVSTDFNTTYTVNGGYVTFGEDVTITAYTGMLELSGLNVYALDVAGSTEGIWLGQNNEDKAESVGVHLVKVE
jgi:hypothetical protein